MAAIHRLIIVSDEVFRRLTPGRLSKHAIAFFLLAQSGALLVRAAF
jgi:hypothetical protein